MKTVVNILERAFSTFYMAFVGTGALTAVSFHAGEGKVLVTAAEAAGVATALSLAKNLSAYFASKGNGSVVDDSFDDGGSVAADDEVTA